MAFGMRYAPATFQRLMNVVLVGLLFCAAYLDDLVVHSESRVDHMEHLSVVFCHLKIDYLSKCKFGQVTVTYLGKEVGGFRFVLLRLRWASPCFQSQLTQLSFAVFW